MQTNNHWAEICNHYGWRFGNMVEFYNSEMVYKHPNGNIPLNAFYVDYDGPYVQGNLAKKLVTDIVLGRLEIVAVYKDEEAYTEAQNKRREDAYNKLEMLSRLDAFDRLVKAGDALACSVLNEFMSEFDPLRAGNDPAEEELEDLIEGWEEDEGQDIVNDALADAPQQDVPENETPVVRVPVLRQNEERFFINDKEVTKEAFEKARKEEEEAFRACLDNIMHYGHFIFK